MRRQATGAVIAARLVVFASRLAWGQDLSAAIEERLAALERRVGQLKRENHELRRQAAPVPPGVGAEQVEIASTTAAVMLVAVNERATALPQLPSQCCHPQ